MMVGENVHYDTYTECEGCQGKRWSIEAEQMINQGLRDEIRALKKLSKALMAAVRHNSTCPFMWRDEPCDCGARDARDAYFEAFPNA